MSEIAIFGGTFDPPTRAHEAIIQSCLDRTDIDEVWVLPSGQRLDKPDMLDNQTRLEMLEAMRHGSFAADEKLVVSDFEMHLPQPTCTYKTVRALRREYPDDTFWFVFGADSYGDMPTWEHGHELRRTLGVLLVSREGALLPSEDDHIRHLAAPDIVDMGISSTAAREVLARGEDVGRFVSRAVTGFLASTACYGRV